MKNNFKTVFLIIGAMLFLSNNIVAQDEWNDLKITKVNREEAKVISISFADEQQVTTKRIDRKSTRLNSSH